MALTHCRQCQGEVSTEALVCPHCGVSEPTAEVQVSAQFAGFLGQRVTGAGEIIQKTAGELKTLGFENLFPYKSWLVDKPWNLLWVRWFVGIALFPLCLTMWAASERLTFESVAFLFAVYFALMWALVLYLVLRPRLALSEIAKVTLFSMLIGVVIVLTAQTLPALKSLYAAAGSSLVTWRLVGFVFGVGIIEEATKALPIWWLFIRSTRQANLSTIMFLGCLSGFAFGVAEAVGFSVAYGLGLAHGYLPLGDLGKGSTFTFTLPVRRGE